MTATSKQFLVASMMALWAFWNSSHGNGVPFAEAFFRKASETQQEDPSFGEEEGILEARNINHANESSASQESLPDSCTPSSYDPKLLQTPCELDRVVERAPERFSLVFPTNYGSFRADCVRKRAPVWVDRVYKLAAHGYYNENYFFRVIPHRYIQFGTHGDPSVSNEYNYTSASDMKCSVLDPQPPFMPYCMKDQRSANQSEEDCDNAEGLSNDFGTLAMSTSYQQGLEGYPKGVTWNATAELFLNIGHHNQFLDENLFVPICTVSQQEMNEVVLKFPSFGEVAELGGDGPSLGALYEEGNAYIASHPEWGSSMARSGTVAVCEA